MAFQVDYTEKENAVLVRVEGEVDMFTSPNLRDVLIPFFKKNVKGIVVDLAGVTFMDSSGIATLVEGLQWSKKQNRVFVLAGLNDTVFNALSLTKLDNVFDIREKAGDAFDALI